MAEPNHIVLGGLFHEEPLPLPESSKQREEVWKDCNLLTFDGGGVRGFWSLLAMRQLMDHISALEMEHNVLHSFHPKPYPREASQMALNHTEQRYKRIYVKDAEIEALDPARRYLPCHYFDYIGGTSTGALIAIMLGRLRMTVLDCIYEYSQMGGSVFGRSGHLRKALMLFTPWTKHRTANAEKAYRDVAKRRCESVHRNGVSAPLTYASEKYVCQTFVTTLLSMQSQAKPYVLRSYEFPTNVEGYQRMLLSPVRKRTIYAEEQSASDELRPIGPKRRREVEQPHNLEIHQVARAATAASKYFDPERVRNAKDDVMTFEDGGLATSNPTLVGMREIKQKHGKNAFGVVVSIGTAKADHVQEKEVGKEYVNQTVKRLTAIATQTEGTHEEAETDCRSENIPYYRLNPGSQKFRLRTVLDEWEPRHDRNGEKPGSRTLRHIKRCFDAWYNSDPEISKYFHQCAKELVERRRRRAQDPAKWERFITGSHFRCQEDECENKDRKFTFYDKFLEHCKKAPELHYSEDPETDAQLLQCSRCEEWKYQERTVRIPWSALCIEP